MEEAALLQLETDLLHENDKVDLAEFELVAIGLADDSDMEEFLDTFYPAQAATPVATPVVMEDTEDMLVTAKLVSTMAGIAGEVGLDSEALPTGHVNVGGASSSSHGPAPAAQTLSLDEELATLGIKEPSGYIYNATRSVLRIQVGKPNKRSTTITCYKHTGCSLLVDVFGNLLEHI